MTYDGRFLLISSSLSLLNRLVDNQLIFRMLDVQNRSLKFSGLLYGTFPWDSFVFLCPLVSSCLIGYFPIALSIYD